MRTLPAVIGFSALAALRLCGAAALEEKEPKQSFDVTTVEHFDFQPGGTVRLDLSYGYLSVEGWDEPQVELTVTKTTNRYYDYEQKKDALDRMGRVRVVTEKTSAQAVTIKTMLPANNHRWAPPFSRTTHAGVTLDYKILIPRHTKLNVRNDYGYVWVNDVMAELDVRSHTGDMIVALPDPGPYAIDARTRLGSITSDFVAKTKNEFLLGSHLRFTSPGAARRVHLRMGRGSITLLKGPASGPHWKD